MSKAVDILEYVIKEFKDRDLINEKHFEDMFVGFQSPRA